MAFALDYFVGYGSSLNHLGSPQYLHLPNCFWQNPPAWKEIASSQSMLDPLVESQGISTFLLKAQKYFHATRKIAEYFSFYTHPCRLLPHPIAILYYFVALAFYPCSPCRSLQCSMLLFATTAKFCPFIVHRSRLNRNCLNSLFAILGFNVRWHKSRKTVYRRTSPKKADHLQRV